MEPAVQVDLAALPIIHVAFNENASVCSLETLPYEKKVIEENSFNNVTNDCSLICDETTLNNLQQDRD